MHWIKLNFIFLIMSLWSLPVSSQSGIVQLLLPEMSTESKGKVSIPVDLEGEVIIAGLGFTFQYDPSVIAFDTFSLGSKFENAFAEYFNAEAGLIKVSIIDPSGFGGSGTLCHVNFTIIGNPEQHTNIELTDIRVYDIDLQPIKYKNIPGKVSFIKN